MPNDDKKPAASAASATQDELSKIKAELAKAQEQIKLQAQELIGADKKISFLEKQLKKAEKSAALEDMTACVNGKIIRITGTVEAKFASDDVRKGFIEEDLQLLIPGRS